MAASKARNLPDSPTGPNAQPRNRARQNADTTSEPEGLTRRVVLNILEAFFRRPWLHVLPFILLVALGAATAFSKTEQFQAVGTITAEESTVIGDITQSGNNGFNVTTPAQATAANINENLRTNEFLDKVADKLQVDAPESQRAFLRLAIARSVGASPDGEQLVRVAAASDRADLSLRIAQATIDAYIETVIDNNARENDEAVEFFDGQVREALDAYSAARQRLNDFLIQNNITNAEDLPVADQIRLDELQSDVDRLEAQYLAQLSSRDQAAQLAASARTEIAQRIRVTDPPELPAFAQPRLRGAVLTVLVFGVLGAVLSLASVVVAATLDRTIRVPGDVTAKFGLDVLAVVPDRALADHG